MSMPGVRTLGLAGGLAACLAWGGAHAQALGPAICGDIHNAYGPYDYRKAERMTVGIVTGNHFTPEVEALQRGHSGYLGADIDYTLRALPNYPRALLAVARYSQKAKSPRPPNLTYPAECYFERAVRFAPDDPMPHVLWAFYLKEWKRPGEIKGQLDQAEALRGEPTNFDLDYNLGLLYLDVKDYDKALVAATRAYALGAPLPALRNKLKAAGKWREPPPVATDPPPPDTAEAPTK